MARKTFRKGGTARYDTGGDIFKKPDTPAAPNPDIFPAKPAVKFVSNPVVQDTTKKAAPSGGGFGAAFKAARAGGDKTFTWNGRSYNTAVKGEGGGSSRPAARAASSTSSSSAPVKRQRESTPEEIERMSIKLGSKPSTGPKPAAAAAAKKDTGPADSDHSSAASRARAGRMLGKGFDFVSKLDPTAMVRKVAWEGGKRLFKPANDADRATTLAALKKAAQAPGATQNAKRRYETAKETGMYAKGGKTESPAMVKKEVDFFKKKKAPKAMIAHEEGELKQAKANPFAKAKKGKKSAPPFAKRENPFSAGQPSKVASAPNPFAKVKGSKKSGGSTAKGKPFAKGGRIDGVASRGHTKARGSS